MQAIQNLGLASVSLIAGLIVDNYGYIWLEVFFIFWLVLAAIATVLLWLVDFHSETKFLNLSTKQRKELEIQTQQGAVTERSQLLNWPDEDIY